MRRLGLFIQTLYDMGRIDELEKLGRPKTIADSSGLQSLLNQTQTHAHLVISAARSYWQCTNNKALSTHKSDPETKPAFKT